MKQQQQQQIDPTFGSVMFNELMMQVLCLSQPLLKAREFGMQIGGRLASSNALVVDECEVLEKVKWICKVFWQDYFGKGADNLKTNHKDLYVVADLNFALFRTLSGSGDSGKQFLEAVQEFLSGLFGGLLEKMGVYWNEIEVEANVEACSLTVSIKTS